MITPKTHAQWLNLTAAWLFVAAVGGCCCLPAVIPFFVAAQGWKATAIAATGLAAFSGFTVACLTLGTYCAVKAGRTPR